MSSVGRKNFEEYISKILFFIYKYLLNYFTYKYRKNRKNIEITQLFY